MRANAYVLLATVWAACAPTSQSIEPVALWGRWEESFTASDGVADDTIMTVNLEAPSGTAHTVEGFWDGGSHWKVRFMPDEAGTWNYRTASAPPVPGLDGQEGAFVVAADAEPSTAFLTHGTVHVSSNSRYLAHADSTPFFWLADTAWNGALMSTDEAWDTYLADRTAKGFTAIQFVTTQWRAADANAEGAIAYTGFEQITINPRFFDRIDQRIEAINDAGLLAAPVLLWTLGEPERNPGRLPESQAIKLARYLVARYQANHVVWILAGDENFSGESGARWRRIGRGVFGGREHAPATIHPQGRQWFFDDFSDEEWLDLIIYQSSHGGGPVTLEWLQSGPPTQKWQQEPIRPVINSEPGYEDIIALERDQPHTADDVRRQLWWSLLNTPTAGVTYGAHGIWSWEVEARVALNHERFGIARPWMEAMRMPGSGHVRHVADLFQSIEWWTLRPRQELILNQSDDPHHHIGAAMSEAGDLAVIYLPRGGEVLLAQDLLRTSVNALWFNPRTGERSSPDSGRYSAPDNEDWALVLQRR